MLATYSTASKRKLETKYTAEQHSEELSHLMPESKSIARFNYHIERIQLPTGRGKDEDDGRLTPLINASSPSSDINQGDNLNLSQTDGPANAGEPRSLRSCVHPHVFDDDLLTVEHYLTRIIHRILKL